MKNKIKILITGADGYLGSLISLELAKLDYISLIRTSRKEKTENGFIKLDVRCEKESDDVISSTIPDIIIHTAALSNILTCEKNPKEAYRTNTLGCYNLAKSANKLGIKIIYLSSLASKNSKLIYGKSKLYGEKHIRDVTAGYQIIYLSMVFGLTPNIKSHRPFNKILNALINKTSISQDNIWEFQPTYTKHLIAVLILLIDHGFKDNDITLTTHEHCTMYKISCDLIGKSLTFSEKKYFNRDLINNNTNDLEIMDLPTLHYTKMLHELKNEIQSYLVLNNKKIEVDN
ncbi:sugar nucleotide-binding protein [Acinetobacter albensis]|uniref:dTDP-4-dehydrorhamnose reductase n=1 Tax=Acinetobacter albensis TaxID=1673609 RepID=A0A1C4GVW2_9GAMM|nr:sugar nucleotide-binding protein [Acinetobacter albensis]SCC71973.1 dTDP-4-dehydrorhamnose reductase [Acinetobacter albensis]